MYRFILTMMLLVCSTACGPKYVDFFPCDDEGRAKPAVAILPIQDLSGACWTWNPSDVLNQTLNSQLMYHGELYLLSKEEMGVAVPASFSTPIEALAAQYPCADFAVLLELVEDGYCAIKARDSVNAIAICMPYETALKMKIRVKIVDLRPRSPRVVLQEIVTNEYLMPLPNWDIDADGTPAYRAHLKMGESLTRRLEQVIQSAY